MHEIKNLISFYSHLTEIMISLLYKLNSNNKGGPPITLQIIERLQELQEIAPKNKNIYWIHFFKKIIASKNAIFYIKF